MPIYEYQHDAAGACVPRFELLQRLSEPPLTVCPTCGKPCHRVLSPFAAPKSGRDLLSRQNLERHGFTQYTRKGQGYYERTAGTDGPETLHRPQ